MNRTRLKPRGCVPWACVALAALGLAGCSAPPDDLGRVGDFSLIERSEKKVQKSDLAGQVWIAAFVFTRCAGSCATLSHHMAQLQGNLAAFPEVRLVSFTVDPEYDTPAVLQAYAARHGADPQRWLFLTGERGTIYRLIGDDFHLYAKPNEGAERQPGYEVAHDNRLVLVDGQGRIRGYFDGLQPDELPRLARQARLLAWQARLPAVNACLNATSAILLALGYLLVRRRWLTLHKACMLTALVVSAVFLASYLYYHFAVRGGEPTRFQGPDAARYTYLAILLTHTLLAVAVAPLALFTAYQGLRNQLPRHVAVARWTLPVWLYVSVTGVVIYWMLYQLYPSS